MARDTRAEYILAYDLSPDVSLKIGRKVVQWPDGYLLSFDEGATSDVRKAYQQFAGPLWPLQLLVAVAMIMALGWLMVETAWLLGKPVRFAQFEAVALAWPLGAGVASVLMLWLNSLGLHLGWQIAAITLLTTGLVAVAIALKRRASSKGRGMRTRG